MFFMYIVLGVAIMLLLSVALAVVKQREIKIDVVSREQAAEKEFFALRIESDDFLFLKEKENVTFIQSLDDANDYKIVDLSKEKKEDSERLFMLKNEKKIS